jgi:hypothetical protein
MAADTPMPDDLRALFVGVHQRPAVLWTFAAFSSVFYIFFTLFLLHQLSLSRKVRQMVSLRKFRSEDLPTALDPSFRTASVNGLLYSDTVVAHHSKGALDKKLRAVKLLEDYGITVLPARVFATSSLIYGSIKAIGMMILCVLLFLLFGYLVIDDLTSYKPFYQRFGEEISLSVRGAISFVFLVGTPIWFTIIFATTLFGAAGAAIEVWSMFTGQTNHLLTLTRRGLRTFCGNTRRFIEVDWRAMSETEQVGRKSGEYLLRIQYVLAGKTEAVRVRCRWSASEFKVIAEALRETQVE